MMAPLYQRATMIELDLATVITLHVAVLLAGCGTFFHLRRLGVKPAALETLGLAYGVQAAGALLAGLGEQQRLPALLWQGGSLWLGVLGYALLWAGLCRLSRGRRRAWETATVAVVPTGCLILTLATDTLSSNLDRAALFHLSALLFLSAAALDIYRRDAAEPLRSRKSLAAVLVLFAGTFLAGLAMLVTGTARPDRMANVFFVQILCYFAVALFVSGFLTERIAAHLRSLAERDPLTGVGNRARLEHLLPETPGAGTAAIMIDIDHFKSVNDRYGHVAGDMVLAEIASLLTEGLRDSDLCIRYGGEEFLIVTRDRDAAQLAERLRGRIAAHAIDIGGHRTVSVTASFGIAVQRDGERAWPDLIEVADQALYAAKAAGRNRVILREATPADAAPALPVDA